MTVGSVINKNQKKIYLYRGNTADESLSTTLYTRPRQFKVGINNGAVDTNHTDLVLPVLISEDTVNDDGNTNLTGSVGGENSTDNTTIYKHGPGAYDNVAQNLLTNTTSATKIWTVTITNLVATKYFGLWLYIKDTATRDKFLSAGTAANIKLRTNGDVADRYYELNFTKAQLANGWNWLSSFSTKVEDLDVGSTGAPTGVLNEMVITITTNNAADSFVAGDVVYDLLKSYTDANTLKSYIATYPVLDLNLLEVETRFNLNSLEANGFFINSIATFNKDTTPLMTSEETFTGDSKTNTDEFSFVINDRFI